MLDSQYIAALRQVPSLYFCKDKDSRYMDASEFFAKGNGFKASKDILGVLDAEMPSPISELAEPFVREDQRVLLNEEPIIMLKGLSFFSNKPFSVWLAQKSLLRDEAGNAIGTVGMGFEITHNRKLLNSILLLDKSFLDKKRELHQFSYTIQDSYTGKVNCSNRETECLFYLLRGKTMKETARRLNLSPKTVEQHLESIKLKMKVGSKSELFERCIIDGMLNVLPTRVYNALSAL